MTEILMRERQNDETSVQMKERQECSMVEMNDTRVAVIGNVDSGKSSLVGVLSTGVLDDGRGQARGAVMRFQHEKENGRTSAVAIEIMGFRVKEKEGKVEGEGDSEREYHQVIPNPRANHDQRWHEVMDKSDHTVSFIDLCGHEKYLKTTVFGLTGLMPDYAMLVVGKSIVSDHD